MNSRKFSLGRDRPLREEMDSMMTDDFDKMRERFHDRARNFRQDNAFDRWFDHSEESAFQPRFKIPKEDERSSYVRNIPIFSEKTPFDDENLMRQGSSAVPKPVPPSTGSQSPQPKEIYAAPPVPHKSKNPVKVMSSSASDSGIDRGTSGSPSDISDSISSASLPRFGFKHANEPAKTKFSNAEKDVPIKVEVAGKNEPIPMGYLPKPRDPDQPIPMGYDRPASAPGDAAASQTQKPRVHKVPGKAIDPDVAAKVHRVPIVIKETPRSASAPPKRTETTPPPSNGPSSAKAKHPLEKIEDILSGVQKLEGRISSFNGSREDHEYRLLDELLTQILMKLDVVSTDGVEEIRKARKSAVKRVNDALSMLESKAGSGGRSSKSISPEVRASPSSKSGSPGPTGLHRTIIALNSVPEKMEVNQEVMITAGTKETMID